MHIPDCETVIKQSANIPYYFYHYPQVEALKELMPTPEELRKLNGFRGDINTLGKAEQFVGAVAAVPRFSARLDMFAFKLNLPHMMMGICDGAAIITEAAEQVMNSKGLALVLRQMLAIGNIMNEGSRKGQASGESEIQCCVHLGQPWLAHLGPPLIGAVDRHSPSPLTLTTLGRYHSGFVAEANPN